MHDANILANELFITVRSRHQAISRARQLLRNLSKRPWMSIGWWVAPSIFFRPSHFDRYGHVASVPQSTVRRDNVVICRLGRDYGWVLPFERPGEGERPFNDRGYFTCHREWPVNWDCVGERCPSPGRERKVCHCQDARKPGSGARDGYPRLSSYLASASSL
jgi:hypothetical protein